VANNEGDSVKGFSESHAMATVLCATATTRPKSYFALRALEPDPTASVLGLGARNVLSRVQVGYH
jgi:hypothetical protein